jgi:hypothetical protein
VRIWDWLDNAEMVAIEFAGGLYVMGLPFGEVLITCGGLIVADVG